MTRLVLGAGLPLSTDSSMPMHNGLLAGQTAIDDLSEGGLSPMVGPKKTG